MDISMSVCGRWRATARYGGPWQGSLPGLAVWGTLHLDGGWTVLEPLGRRDNPPDQRTSPSLPGDRPGAQKRKRGFAGFFRWHNTFSESRWIHTCGFSHCQRHREKQAGARPTVSRGFLHHRTRIWPPLACWGSGGMAQPVGPLFGTRWPNRGPGPVPARTFPAPLQGGGQKWPS